MKIDISTNHHYYEDTAFSEDEVRKCFGVSNQKDFKKLQDVFSTPFEINTKSSQIQKIKLFGFSSQKKAFDDEKLILKLTTKENNIGDKQYLIQTGLYAGIIYHKGVQFNITTRYGDNFLKRMLNFVNDIYIDNTSTSAKQSKTHNEFNNIIAFLFIQSLEKSAVLGLPKVYKTLTQRSAKVRGKVDINSYLKKDIPFKGKLTTKYKEQVYIQEIIDVLYATCKVLEKEFGKEIHHKILGIFQVLKENYSGVFPSNYSIQKAKEQTVLNNPIYSAFKKVLSYAEIILKEKKLILSENTTSITTQGYLFDISQLFEVYLEKLLSKHLSNWYVTGQEEINTYEGLFYKRKMSPDLVLRHKDTNQVIVFDAKFKKMCFRKYDLDREDFYQIHSYMTYYQPDIILGGLLYPLSKRINMEKSYASNIFQNSHFNTQFIIDGIYVTEDMSLNDINNSEIEFIDRIKSIVTVF